LYYKGFSTFENVSVNMVNVKRLYITNKSSPATCVGELS